MEQLLWLSVLAINLKLFILVFLVLYIKKRLKKQVALRKKYATHKKAFWLTPVVYLCLMAIAYFIFNKSEGVALETNNTIIVLGNPATEDGKPSLILKSRLDHALKVYNQLDVATIIVTGGAVHNEFVEAEVMKNYLAEHNVPAQKIIVEANARNTYENAQFSSKIVDSLQLKRPIIVTSHPHRMRSEKMFSNFISDVVFRTPKPSFFKFLKYFPIYMYETSLIFKLGDGKQLDRKPQT